MLTDRTWKLKYTPDDGDLGQLFSMPTLPDASRRDRLALYLEGIVVDNEPRGSRKRADYNRQPRARGSARLVARRRAKRHAALALFGTGSFSTRTPSAVPRCCAAMMNEPDARFHFSVWRSARIDRTYLLVTGSASGPERTALLDGSAVLEQLYAWDPGRHDFALSLSLAAMQLINDRLIQPFGEHRSPKERRVRRFLNAVTKLLDDGEVQSGTHWSDSEDTVSEGDTELNLRVNAAIGVLSHLRWVAQVYAEVPDASVLIR